MPGATWCPDPNDVQAFIDGRLQGAARSELEKHLDTCASCRELVSELARAADPTDPGDTIDEGDPADGSAPTQAHDPRKEPPRRPSEDEVLRPGVRLGRYQIRRLLGSGGMGRVYLAYDPDLERPVALKVLRPNLSSDPETRARLLREAQAMARLSHPNVVAVHDVGDEEGRIFIAMEYVEGISLSEWLREKRSVRQLLAIFRGAGAGLAAAHDAGIVHRDFKPDNVMVRSDEVARVTDFGLARSAGAEASLSEAKGSATLSMALTQAGALMGTPAFMSPEQFLAEPTDAASDQFSFCVALYQALYRQRPFPGNEPLALRQAVIEGRLQPAPRDRRVPPWIRKALHRGLSPKAAQRFPDMHALLAELDHELPNAEPRRADPRSAATAVSVGLAVAALAAALSATSAFRSFEERAQGLVLAARPRPWDPRVLILSIDQGSIRRFGWPMPRKLHARVVEALGAAGASAVGIDSFFYLPARDEPASDVRFGEALAAYGRAVLAVPCTTDQAVDPDRLASDLRGSVLPVPILQGDLRCERALTPVEPLQRSAHLAQVEVARSATGIARGAYAVSSVAGGALPTLAVALYAAGEGVPATLISREGGALWVGDLRVPLDGAGAVVASFRLPPDEAVVSYAELVDAIGPADPPRLPPELAARVKGSYVLWGQTAEGARDLGPFATGQNLPLVLLHGALLGDLLEARPVRELSLPLQLALALLLGALACACAAALRPPIAALSIGACVLGSTGGALFAWQFLGILAGPLGPTAAALAGFAATLAARISLDERRRRPLRNAFSENVEEATLSRLSRTSGPLELTGARKHVTVVHALFGARGGTPEETLGALREEVARARREVLSRAGRIEVVSGGQVVAIFGDLPPRPDHARRAVDAALALCAAARARLSVGVATGEVVVGDVGSGGDRIEYTSFGAPLQAAASLARDAGEGTVRIGVETRDACATAFELRPAGGDAYDVVRRR